MRFHEQPAASSAAFKTQTPGPFLNSPAGQNDTYPISASITSQATGATQWTQAQQGRPTLTGGVASGRIAGSTD